MMILDVKEEEEEEKYIYMYEGEWRAQIKNRMQSDHFFQSVRVTLLAFMYNRLVANGYLILDYNIRY
jgi:hypothetical protein